VSREDDWGKERYPWSPTAVQSATVMRRSSEGFCRLQMVFARESKGDRGGGSRGFYRWPCMGKGLGFRGLGDGRLGVTSGSARTLARGGRCP
jgi:hypothetical protein